MRVLLPLSLLLLAVPARAALDVAWDCYLPKGPADCRALETAFFSNPAYVRAGDDPDAWITLRAAQMADGTALDVNVRDKDGGVFSYTDRIPRGFSSDAVLLRIVGVLQKSTAHLFVVDEPGVMQDGVLSLRLRDPDAGPRKAVNAERFGITQCGRMAGCRSIGRIPRGDCAAPAGPTIGSCSRAPRRSVTRT
jgi:hypothetical protein